MPRVAEDARAEAPLPRVLAGEEVHDIAAEAPGGRGPCALAVELTLLDTLRQADWWVERYPRWRGFWADFFEDAGVVDGRCRLTHERIRKARSPLSRLAYLDPELA